MFMPRHATTERHHWRTRDYRTAPDETCIGDGFDSFGKVIGDDPRRCQMLQLAMAGNLNHVNLHKATNPAPEKKKPRQLGARAKKAAGFDDPTRTIAERIYLISRVQVTAFDIEQITGLDIERIRAVAKHLVEVGALDKSGIKEKGLSRVAYTQVPNMFRHAKSPKEVCRSTAIMDLMADGEPRTTGEISRACKMSAKVIYTTIVGLRLEGKLERIGHSNRCAYRLKRDEPDES